VAFDAENKEPLFAVKSELSDRFDSCGEGKMELFD
jgi:hypothetical protein